MEIHFTITSNQPDTLLEKYHQVLHETKGFQSVNAIPKWYELVNGTISLDLRTSEKFGNKLMKKYGLKPFHQNNAQISIEDFSKEMIV